MGNWTRVKQVYKEELQKRKLSEAEQKAQIDKTELYQRELFSFIRQSRYTAHDLAAFGDWLKSNFKSNSQFLKFLKTFDIDPDVKAEIKRKVKAREKLTAEEHKLRELNTFLNEYSRQLDNDITYDKYLKWLNSTIYDKSPLVIVGFNTYFSNLPEKKLITSVHKGIVAKSEKSKRSLAELKSSVFIKGGENMRSCVRLKQTPYQHIITYADTWVNAFIKWNARRLRMGQVAQMKATEITFEKCKVKGDIPDCSKLKTAEVKWSQENPQRWADANLGINGQALHKAYKFLGAYGFKNKINQLSAYEAKKEYKAAVKANSNRVEKLKTDTKTNVDLSLINDYLMRRRDYSFHTLNDPIRSRTVVKYMYELLKTKKFSNFHDNIKLDNEDAYKQSRLFIEGVEKKMQMVRASRVVEDKQLV